MRCFHLFEEQSLQWWICYQFVVVAVAGFVDVVVAVVVDAIASPLLVQSSFVV